MELLFEAQCKIAACNLNQWALDFEGNKRNIIKSLEIAKEMNCTIRSGPELEITGYSCEDHFLELDTVIHSWQVLAEILATDLTNGILSDFGMPVEHRGVLYNCRVVVLDRQILLIRPKVALAMDGNYREARFFTEWSKSELEDILLPEVITRVNGQTKTKIGIAVIQAHDTEIGYEICEELWQPSSPHIELGLDGVEIIINSSASHHELYKLQRRIQLILDASKKSGGGCYVYSNLIGCDGQRIYFDGISLIAQNGKIYNMGSRFSSKKVEVVAAVIDLNETREARINSKSRCHAAGNLKNSFPRIQANIKICREQTTLSQPVHVTLIDPSEETGKGPAYYLWDYLKKSKARGFFLPLSGGSDSATVAVMVYYMTKMILQEIIIENNLETLQDLRNILRDQQYTPNNDPKELTGKILFTGYMPTQNSSQMTRQRAENLAKEIGSTYYVLPIDDTVMAYKNIALGAFGKEPQFKAHGGQWQEDIALQNIQARSRMVCAYMMAQLIPQHIGSEGFILVLASGNLDESLRGYMTKYDCSSADLNPIGSLSKRDINKFLGWAIKELKLETLRDILQSTPTAELTPLDKNQQIAQSDEADMGMTYDELSRYGTLRKINKFGPYTMFKRLIQEWNHLSWLDVAKKVKHFFKFYAINRHKMTTLTPSIHCEGYSNDDNRYDLRPFLYDTTWKYQFEKIQDAITEKTRRKVLITSNDSQT